MDGEQIYRDLNEGDNVRPIATFEMIEFKDFKWAHAFVRAERGFFRCACACLILLSLDINAKRNHSQIFEAMSRDFSKVEVNCQAAGLNFYIFSEFSKIFELMLFGSTSSIGFSYLRYYLEQSDRHMIISFDYAMRFLFYTFFISEDKKIKVLAGKSSDIWMNCLEFLSLNYKIKFKVFENGISRSISNSQSIFKCHLKKEGRRFSLLYKASNFDNLDQNFIFDRSLWKFKSIVDESPSNSPRSDLSTNLSRNRRRYLVNINYFQLRVRKFLKVSDIILSFYNIPIPSDDSKAKFFCKNKIEKYINYSGIKLYFEKFLPSQEYEISDFFLVSKQVHVIFECRQISIDSYTRMMGLYVNFNSIKSVVKASLIEIIIGLINHYTKKCR